MREEAEVHSLEWAIAANDPQQPIKQRLNLPIRAKNTVQRSNELARWVFRGFWRGRGEVSFADSPNGVIVEGCEEIAVRWLFFLSPLIELLFLERSFHLIWEIGWHRLRKRESARRVSAIDNHPSFNEFAKE